MIRLLPENHNGKYWTRAWNPVTGCVKAGPACNNCWAHVMHERFPQHHGIPDFSVPQFHENRLNAPLKWKQPQIVAVCWLGDLFYNGVPVEWVDRVYRIMELATQHTFLVLTKRPERMARYVEYVGSRMGISSNIYHGVSAWDQPSWDRNVGILCDIPAAHRWVSVEPMLGEIDVTQTYLGQDCYANPLTKDVWCAGRGPQTPLDASVGWVVLGGDSSGSPVLNLDWVRRVRDDCAMADVPFFYKQRNRKGDRLLDGREHNGMPVMEK